MSLRRYLLLSLFLPLLAGCQTAGFYTQAVRGQWQIISKREPVTQVLADTNTPPKLRAKLELVMELRSFADKELKLPVANHYDTYADVERRFVVWNVFAAPEFSLQPIAWWYPIVGRLSYRGFFNEAKAEAYAKEIRAKGWDVTVDGIEAYSTLGWFRDPLLNTFINQADVALADVLFHELTHQRFFVSGDTDFNEAFAITVAEEGVHRWLRSKGDVASIQKYEQMLRRDREFVSLILATQNELHPLYAAYAKGEISDEVCRERKAASIANLRTRYDQLKTTWDGYDGYDGWFDKPVNNARLSSVVTYFHWVPVFREMLNERSGDLAAFYRDVERLGKLSRAERHAYMDNRLAQQTLELSFQGKN